MGKTESSMKLQTLQRTFLRRAILPEKDRLEEVLDTRNISADGLIDVYHTSIIGNITHALEHTYPVIKKLVGDAFFGQCCKLYLQQHPPTSANMDDYGIEFAEFIANFKPAATLHYLPDTAKLEWRFHQSALADDASRLDKAQLATIPPEKLADHSVQFHPSAHLMTSEFPVDRIWQMNLENTDDSETLDLSTAGGCNLLIIRRGLQVEIISLPVAEYIFLHTLQHGQNFMDAFEQALGKNQHFDLSASLVKFIDIGVFSQTI